MFRRLNKVPLSTLLLELAVKSYTGHISLVGDTSAGYVMMDVDLNRGKLLKCKLKIEGKEVPPASCLNRLADTLCMSCFAEVDERIKNTGLEGLSLMAEDLPRHKELEVFSSRLMSEEYMRKLSKVSRTASFITASPTMLIKGLGFAAGANPIMLTIRSNKLKSVAIAHNHVLLAVCTWTGSEALCGEEGLNKITSLNEETLGIYSYIDINMLPEKMKAAIGLNNR